MKKFLFVASIALVAALPAAGASASPLAPVQISDWPLNDGFNGGNTAIASDPTTGNSVIVYGYNDGVNSYYTQLVDAAGSPVGAAQRLTDKARWAQPSIAWNPSTGGYLTCWGNYTGSLPVDMKCDALAADGTPAGSPSTITSTPDQYTMTNLAWSTSKGKFLVTMTDWDSYARASLVDSSGAPSGSLINFMSGYDFTGGAGVAYSPASDRFMVWARGKTNASSEQDAPWLWLLDGDGNPVGSPQRIDADTAVAFKNASIAWNSVRDEFAVMSIGYETGQEPEFYIRRYKATDGSPVGDAKTATVSNTEFDNSWGGRFRPQLAANAFADQMLAYVVLDTDPTGAADNFGVYAMDVAGDGTMGALQPVAGGISSYRTYTRPWLTFNPSSCEYLGDYNALDTSATSKWQLYTARYTQADPCKADLTVAKAGTGSGTVSGTATESQMGLGSESVAEGTTSLYRSYKVSLTATAASGSTFTGWSGACSGTGACEVAMSEARSVTATFTGADPTPPSNEISVLSTRASGSAVTTRVRVPGAGALSQRGTYRTSGAAATKTACSTSKSASAAGTYTLTCRLNSAARKQRKKSALRVRVVTTFTPTGGTAASKARTVVFRSLKPNYTG